MVKLSGWGRFPVIDCPLRAPRDEDDLRAALNVGGVIARGNGRAYGDAALSRGMTLPMHHFNRMLAFDEGAGQLVAEAGVLLGDIVQAFLPRGWFPSVTPGTKFVTLGGMIAADVHGKNHHREGAFGNFVDWIDVMGADGSVTRTVPGEPLFDWTVGGMGLTGVILRAAIRLRRVETGWIRQTTIATANLEATMQAFDGAQDATYSVAWIDCLARGAARGRSVLMLGEHAPRDALSGKPARTPWGPPRARSLTVPMDAPGWALNRLTMGAFNRLYYAKGHRDAGETLVGWDPFFYPLDSILGWNRIYGRRGFMQFQCVLPLASSHDGVGAMLGAMEAAGQGAFLSVLKRMGPGARRFSFPMEGYTLAVDFPVTRTSLKLMKRLDAITTEHGGRFYLAKDARMTARTLHRADPRAAQFGDMRAEEGMHNAFASVQSERLEL